jgi:hypothetical protein
VSAAPMSEDVLLHLREVIKKLELVCAQVERLQEAAGSIASLVREPAEASSSALCSGPRRGPGDERLTVKQAAEEFNLKPKWFHAHWQEIPGAGKFGAKQVRLPRSGLEKFMARCRERD